MASTTSKQPRFDQKKDVNAYFWTFLSSLSRADEIPKWGSGGRDAQLRDFAQKEPILSGALATVVSKATALDWQLVGGKNRVKRYHEILSEAEDGAGWTYFLDRLAQDYLTTDIGGVAELGRERIGAGAVTGLYNLDSTTLTLTGNVAYPIKYSPKVGSVSTVSLAPGDFARIVDLPSPDEQKFGLGYCAVSRALKAAQVLMALYQYEEEQLSDLPPQGIASITGMSMDQVNKAFDLYEAKRSSKEQMTFKGVLWLAAQANTMTPIGVDVTPFSSLPDHFDKEKATTLYVYTLALDFGVDVREFWPASQTGATKAEAEVQHQKAKGKGFGRMLMEIERAINWEVLPEGIEFAFDQIDSQDDITRHQVRQAAIENIRRLWEPAMGAEGLIDRDEARRLLVDEGVLPDWLGVAGSTDTTVHGTSEKAKELLQPGEDLVAINLAGEMRTVWSARKSYAIQFPTDVLPRLQNNTSVAGEGGATDPFVRY